MTGARRRETRPAQGAETSFGARRAQDLRAAGLQGPSGVAAIAQMRVQSIHPVGI